MSFRSIARLGILSAIALAGAGAASADVFLKIPGVTGDATQRGFEGQVRATGATMNVSTFTTPDPSGAADTVRQTSVGPIYINKSPDRASPRLTSMAVDGAPLGKIEITFTDNATGAVTSKWIVEGAEMHSISIAPDQNSQHTETVEIGFSAMTYQYFDAAKGKGPIEETHFDVPEQQLFPFDEGCG